MSNRSIFGDKAISGPINRDAARVVKGKQHPHKSLNYLCRRCGKEFLSKHELDAHLHQYHTKSTEIIENLQANSLLRKH